MARPENHHIMNDRRMRHILSLACAALVLFCILAPPARADILIIANPQAEISSLGRQKLKSIYLNQTATWPNGLEIKLVVLAEEGPRQEFCRNIVGKDASQFERHWRRQLFIGKGMPPLELQTSAEVIKHVRTTPGAIGFIADRPPRPAGVVVVTITP